jgi:hypothetical protein
MKHKKHLLTLALLASLTTNSAQALLIDRGNGLLYDNVLKVTWLQDANYAQTSGYSATGQMNWASANTWADNLIFDGLTGWRLATNTPINGNSFNSNVTYDGTTDYSYNITSPKSELSYMYYVNLGLKGVSSMTGAYQSDFGIFGNGTYGGQANIGPVINMQSHIYWSGAEFSPGSGYGWAFNSQAGVQGAMPYNLYSEFYAWAVRPGDVIAVPEPATFWLFSIGLMSLLSLRRRGNIG